MSGRRNLVIGLPESGKTTFIAAFWHVVESEEVPSALRVKELTGDRAYLNKLRNAWLRCEPVGKTLPENETTVRMLLEDRASQGTSELLLPDIAGETFRDQWVNRRWSKHFDELVLAADGALLFVHPSRIEEPIRIDTVSALVEDLRGSSIDGGLTAAGPEGAGAIGAATPAIWDPATAPTQVQLVDLMQFLIWRRGGDRLNLAVIVSAWDLVRKDGSSPSRWCASRLPLLGQFITSNAERLRVDYYGVSAQGGELPRDADRLRALTHAFQRLEVVSDDLTTSHDVTLPVQRLGAWG